MAKIYVRMIKAGRMTIDEVPERWRAEVEALLAAEKPAAAEPTVESTEEPVEEPTV